MNSNGMTTTSNTNSVGLSSKQNFRRTLSSTTGNGTTTSNNNSRSNSSNNNNNSSIVSNNSSSNNSNSKSAKKKFYPKLIATQIVAIQCFHYFILTLLYEINAMIFPIGGGGDHTSFVIQVSSSEPTSMTLPTSSTTLSLTYMSLDRIFTDQYIHLYRLSSYPDIITVFLAAICTAYIFVVIVEKSKQCLDFAITLFLFHFILVTFYNRTFPTHIEWYIIHIIATIIMILLAEHLCAKRELDDIPLLTL